MAGVRHVVAPPPNRRPTHLPPDPARASEMLVDENQRMADEKRRAKLAQRMQEREETLSHMANYGMGGADGRGADDLQDLVRNQQQSLQQDRRILGIDADQGRRPQAIQRPRPGEEKPPEKVAHKIHSDSRMEGEVPRFGAIVSNMGGRKEQAKTSLFGGDGGGGGAFAGGPPRGGPFGGGSGGGGAGGGAGGPPGESERDRRLRERRAQAFGAADVGGDGGEDRGGDGGKRADLFGGGAGAGSADFLAGAPSGRGVPGPKPAMSKREQVYEEKRRRHLQQGGGGGRGGGSDGASDGDGRFQGFDRGGHGGGEGHGGMVQAPPGVGANVRGGGGDAGGHKNRRDAVWEEKRRRALERAQGGGGGGAAAAAKFPDMAPPPRFDDFGGVPRGGGAAPFEGEADRGAAAPPPRNRGDVGDAEAFGAGKGRNADKNGELDMLDQAFAQKNRGGPVSRPARRRDDPPPAHPNPAHGNSHMGTEFRGDEFGGEFGLHVGKSEDKREADRRKAEYAADLQRQMNKQGHNAPKIGQGPPPHGRNDQDFFGSPAGAHPPMGAQPSIGGDGGGGVAVGLQVGMRGKDVGPPAGGRRQNMSNMYQDDWEAQERERRKAEYAKDLQGQMQHKAAINCNGNAGSGGRAMHVNPVNYGGRMPNGNAEGMEMPGGGNLFGGGGGPGGGGMQGPMAKPSISNMFGGDGGAERERRKQEYAQDLQNQIRHKAENDPPARAQHGGMPGDGGWGQGGAPGSCPDNASGVGAGGGWGMGGGGGGPGGMGVGGFGNAGAGGGGMVGGGVGVGLGDIGGGNADAVRQRGGRGAFTNMHNDPQQLNEADRKRAQYADELRQQMEAAKAQKERDKAAEALRDKQDAERLIREQQREDALAAVPRDQFGNPLPIAPPPHLHHPAAPAHGIHNHQQGPGFAHGGAGMATGFEGGAGAVPGGMGARPEWEGGGAQRNGAGMGSPLRGQLQPGGMGHAPMQAPPRARGRSDGPPPAPQPLNEIQAELQQMIEEKKRRKEKEEWEEKERERKDNERLERQRAELAAQAAKELEKKLAKDAAAAAAGGGGGNLLARTPIPAGGQAYLGADSGSPQQRPPADAGLGSARPPLFGRRSSDGGGHGGGGLHVRVEDSVEGSLAPALAGSSPAIGVPIKAVAPPARGEQRRDRGSEAIGDHERVAGMGATGRGALRVGDPTDVLSSEAVEKDRMQAGLLKEQKRLEKLVIDQQQQLSSLQSQLQSGVSAPGASRPDAAQPPSSRTPLKDDSMFGSPAPRRAAGLREQEGGRGSAVGDAQGGTVGRGAGQQGMPAEWGSAAGPLVLPHDLKYLEATGLSRPVSAAVDWTGGQGAGAGVREAKAGRRLAVQDQEHVRRRGHDAVFDDLQQGAPPPPHPRARSAGGPASRGRGAGSDWNAVELSLDYDNLSPALAPSGGPPSRSLPPSRGGGGGSAARGDMEETDEEAFGGLHVASVLRNATPDEFEKSLAGASAFVAPNSMVPFLQDGMGGRAPAGARGLRTPKSLARAREIGSQGSDAAPKFYGDEVWDKSMVGASELVLPPPHPRAIAGAGGDVSDSRPGSAAGSVASIESSIGAKHMPSPSHFDALNKRRMSKLAGLQQELNNL